MVTRALNSLLHGWKIHVVDATRHSRSLALCFNPRSINLINIWGKENSLGLDVLSESFGMHFTIINVYVPYSNKKPFWDSFMNASVMRSENIILVGDTNFSLGISES